MELIIIWAATIAATFGLDFAVGIKIIKDIADCGYKFDVERNFPSPKPEQEKIVKIIKFIPFLNLLSVITTAATYKNNQNLIINQYKALGVLSEMSEEDFEKYKKKANILTAMWYGLGINILYDELMQEKDDENEFIYSLDIEDEGTITFKVEKPDKIQIIETIGEVSKLSEDEQLKKIKEICRIVVDDYKDNPENIEVNIENIEQDNKINTNVNNNDKIRLLTEMKKELLSFKEEEKNNENDGPKLTK